MFTRNLSLMYTDAPDENGGGNVDPAAGGENPNWDTIKGKLDPVSWEQIRPDLEAFDKNVQTRITSQNEQFKWAKELVDSGVTPELVQQSLQVATRLDSEPEVVYQMLAEFLEKNGRMPTKAEQESELEENENENDSDPKPQESKALAELKRQQEEMRQQWESYTEAQQQQALETQIRGQIEQELADLKQAHPEYSQAEIQWIIEHAAGKSNANAASGIDTPVTISQAASEFAAMRDSILTSKRPGDSAPSLLPTSGGVGAAENQSKSLREMSKNERENLVVAMLEKANGS